MIDVVTILTSAVAISSATILTVFRNRCEPAPPDRLIWWLPLATVLSAGAALVFLIVNGANDLVIFMLLIAPTACCAGLIWLLVGAIQKRPRLCLSVLLAIIGSVAMTWSLERNEETIRPFVRWRLWSQHYKSQLMTQPAPANGEFKHLEWDSWGIVPSGFTLTYLVFDPSDSLASAAKTKLAGKFNGIPCEVPGVLRLEKQWYSVKFYTDEGWRDCASSVSRGSDRSR